MNFKMSLLKVALLFVLLILLLNCNDTPKLNISGKVSSAKGGSDKSPYQKVIEEKEAASVSKSYHSLGKVIKTIEFKVTTNNRKDFEDGIIPWAQIENPDLDIPNLIDKDEIVIDTNDVTVIIDYPLSNEYRFKINSKKGLTREALLKHISEHYYNIYKEEEETASIKTIPQSKRIGIYNRNETNGKYGIWGHDLADLVLAEIVVHRSTNGDLILSLNVMS